MFSNQGFKPLSSLNEEMIIGVANGDRTRKPSEPQSDALTNLSYAHREILVSRFETYPRADSNGRPSA